MYKIKPFKQFLNEFELDGEVQQSKPIWNGKDYLDKDGNINLYNMNLSEFPCIFPEKWDKGFYCIGNKLTSLKGAPKEVGGNFYCYNNKLTSLKGAPREVGGNFKCSNNKIKFTEGDVRKACQVGGSVYV